MQTPDRRETGRYPAGVTRTVADSQRLGRAAVLTMLRVASRCPGAVLDSTWFGYALPLARALPGKLVEVHCTVPRDVARARYQARAAYRHAGHLDDLRSDQELWGAPASSPGLGPVIQVDTSGDIDMDQLIEKLDQVRRE
jgi:hypothetical protein